MQHLAVVWKRFRRAFPRFSQDRGAAVLGWVLCVCVVWGIARTSLKFCPLSQRERLVHELTDV